MILEDTYTGITDLTAVKGAAWSFIHPNFIFMNVKNGVTAIDISNRTGPYITYPFQDSTYFISGAGLIAINNSLFAQQNTIGSIIALDITTPTALKVINTVADEHYKIGGGLAINDKNLFAAAVPLGDFQDFITIYKI